MASEMKPNTGTCKFCGQSVFIDTVGEVTQAELDAMATEKCNCPAADQERRKKEREQKTEEFVNKHFKGRIRDKIYQAIDDVTDSNNGIIEVAIKTSTDWSIRVYVDSDYYLHIKAKVVDDYELKI